MKIKMKKRLQTRDEIIRPRSRHAHKYRKCKKCPCMMMLICIQAVLHRTICMIRFASQLFGFQISSYISKETELILSFKNLIIQILMQKVVTIL